MLSAVIWVPTSFCFATLYVTAMFCRSLAAVASEAPVQNTTGFAIRPDVFYGSRRRGPNHAAINFSEASLK